jgi:CubicO group peptidase (beta-lactamase class C family)
MLQTFCVYYKFYQTKASLFYRIGKYFTLFFLPFFCVACNTTEQKVGSNKDSIPVPKIINGIVQISTVEKQQLNAACKLWYDTTLLNKGFNGGILIAKKGNIVFEDYHGTAHLPGNDTVNSNTPFHIASVSKTFTAMMVLKLAQQQLLQIDDAFSKYFPAFNYPGVTIRTLLNHRSGLPNYVYFMEKLGWDKTKYVTNTDVLNYLINKKSLLTNITAPNVRFTYCNTNYALLALLVEKITGEDFATYLQKNVFRPLQMKNTFVFDTTMLTKVNESYDWRGRLMPFNYLDAVYGDKNVYSTVQDLFLWDRAISNSNMFTQQTLEEAYAPYSNERPGVRNYGLGWRMFLYPNGKKIVYHNGWWHGNNASFVRLVQDDATIIIIGNKFNRNIYHGRDLANLFGNYSPISDEEENDPAKNAATDTAILNQVQVKAAPARVKKLSLTKIVKNKQLVKKSTKTELQSKAKPLPIAKKTNKKTIIVKQIKATKKVRKGK